MMLNGPCICQDYSHVEKVLIKSHAKLELSDDIHDERQSDNEISVATLAYSNIVVIVEKETPLWIYLLSVLVGLALFLLSVLGFWMVSLHLNSFKWRERQFGLNIHLCAI